MSRCPERRYLERFLVADMKASISVQYRFGTHHGDVIDFNQGGVTVVLRRPIPINKPLFIALMYKGSRLDGIVGAAHHCRFTMQGEFRCGIRFRTNSPIQLDRDEIEARLQSVENAIAEALIHTAT
jgi:hypothetical protein